MKKIIALFIVFIISAPCFAQVQPEWSEFCPKRYLNAKYRENNSHANRLFGGLLTCTIYGAPIGIPILIWNKNVDNRNYWANRRTEFNNEIEGCNRMDNYDSKINCYASVRSIEYSKNQDYYASTTNTSSSSSSDNTSSGTTEHHHKHNHHDSDFDFDYRIHSHHRKHHHH